LYFNVLFRLGRAFSHSIQKFFSNSDRYESIARVVPILLLLSATCSPASVILGVSLDQKIEIQLDLTQTGVVDFGQGLVFQRIDGDTVILVQGTLLARR